jgi:hypothetical protein
MYPLKVLVSVRVDGASTSSPGVGNRVVVYHFYYFCCLSQIFGFGFV